MVDPEGPGWTWLPLYDKQTQDARAERNKQFVFPQCGMRFIDDHAGLRPGCIHTLLGSTGKGKSTLTQSLILEWGKKEKILLYLSEESLDRVEGKFYEKDPDATYLSSKLHLSHERELLKTLKPSDYQGFCQALEDKLIYSGAKILVIDNLTTSQFYEFKFQNVMPLIAGLRDIADKHQIAIFLVCHTKKGISETSKGFISPDDVRGSASLPMTSDYFYTFHRVRQTTEMGTTNEASFIYVNKCRDHDIQDYVYRLDYNVHKKRYVKDTLVNFKLFREALRERDKL